VDVYDLEVAKVDAVGTECPRTPVEIRIHHLMCERNPSASRAAGEQARPRLALDTEFRLDCRNELLHYRVAVRAVVRGIHTVRIIIVRRRMLQRDEDHARRSVSEPVARELCASS